MPSAVLFLVTGGCVKPVTIWDPVLLSPAAQPIPAGVIATEPELVEVKACGLEYQGLDPMIEQARRGADGLVQISVDVQRTYAYGRLASQCYVLRGYRVTYRVE